MEKIIITKTEKNIRIDTDGLYYIEVLGLLQHAIVKICQEEDKRNAVKIDNKKASNKDI